MNENARRSLLQASAQRSQTMEKHVYNLYGIPAFCHTKRSVASSGSEYSDNIFTPWVKSLTAWYQATAQSS